MSERGDDVGRAAVPLSLPSDAENLSKSLCILRGQIEIFAATSDDVAARKRHPPKLGAVGLRCRHCNHLPISSRAKGSVSYPKSISLIHQTIRNFHRFHFYQCEFIPEADKEAMRAIGKNKQPSKKGSDVYWVQSSKEQLGMMDEDNGSGGSCIRFSENSPFHARVVHESGNIGGGGRIDGMEAPVVAVANECMPKADESIIYNTNDDDILELFSGEAFDDEAFEDDLAAVQEVIDVENDGGRSSEHFSATEQKLLENVGFILSTVRQTISTLPVDDTTATLVELGKTAYSILTGTEFTDAVLVDGGCGASSTDDTVDAVVESLSKTDFDEQDQQKKRRRPAPVHVGSERPHPSAFDSLCESTNLPSQLCFLLSGLLANSADEGDHTEVYASLEEVESDLCSMLRDPERHLFDIPPSEQSGKLLFDPLKLYG